MCTEIRWKTHSGDTAGVTVYAPTVDLPDRVRLTIGHDLHLHIPQASARRIAQALIDAGVLRGGSEIAPVNAATTVRVRDGKTLRTTGAFAETREQLGGYYLIDCATLDEAVNWAAQCPSALNGAIEIRPLVIDHE